MPFYLGSPFFYISEGNTNRNEKTEPGERRKWRGNVHNIHRCRASGHPSPIPTVRARVAVLPAQLSCSCSCCWSRPGVCSHAGAVLELEGDELFSVADRERRLHATHKVRSSDSRLVSLRCSATSYLLVPRIVPPCRPGPAWPSRLAVPRAHPCPAGSEAFSLPRTRALPCAGQRGAVRGSAGRG